MPEYLSPGVYVEEVEMGPKPVEGVGTSTAGFLGVTERGPTKPKLVTSFADYRRTFGGFIGASNLPYAVDGFFRNGGQRCYVGRITADTNVAGATLEDEDRNESLTVTANGPGAWGGDVAVQVSDASLDAANLFKLRIGYWVAEMDRQLGYEKLVEEHGTPAMEEVYDNLSVVETSSNYFGKSVGDGSDLVLLERPPEEPETEAKRPKNATVWLGFENDLNSDGGNDVDTTEDTDDSDTTTDDEDGNGDNGDNGDDVETDGGVDTGVGFRGDGGVAAVTRSDYEGSDTPGARTGLAAFTEIDEINMVCIPDENELDGLRVTIKDHCESMGDRFAILQTARGTQPDDDLPPNDVVSDYAAIYYPWIEVMDPLTNVRKLVPPGGHMAGIYARNDTERGVHKAPANETVRGAVGLELSITKGEQDILNPQGVNCIRSFRGRGIRVWGARTTSSDPLWKYVNVRRLFLYLEESIDEGTQWVVFEPNDERLWARVRQTITNFLTTEWRNGALMGTTPDQAFFVKCDRTTMTQNDIDNGRLIVEIGVAPVKPAEFVVFRIAQWTGGMEGS